MKTFRDFVFELHEVRPGIWEETMKNNDGTEVKTR